MKVVFMSGYSESSLLDRHMLASGGAYLAEPFYPEPLAAMVREVLGPLHASGTIVVADDEPGIRDLLRDILAAAGYQILEAKNGRDAMQQVRTAHVDLLITDLAMPEQEGIETIQALHRERPELEVIAISGQFAGSGLRVAEALGAQASLAKPIQADKLLETVARVMVG